MPHNTFGIISPSVDPNATRHDRPNMCVNMLSMMLTKTHSFHFVVSVPAVCRGQLIIHFSKPLSFLTGFFFYNFDDNTGFCATLLSIQMLYLSENIHYPLGTPSVSLKCESL